MERTIEVKMAKPSQDDFDTVHDFLKGLEIILEEGCIPKDDLEDDTNLPDATAEHVLDWLEHKWRTVGRSWSRVLWAGKTAIDNACDPDADVLEFKPEIVRAVESHAELLKAVQGYCGIDGRDGSRAIQEWFAKFGPRLISVDAAASSD